MFENIIRNREKRYLQLMENFQNFCVKLLWGKVKIHDINLWISPPDKILISQIITIRGLKSTCCWTMELPVP
jgi:hypothetical protein